VKKKVLIQTDFALAKTGFGRNAKELIKYLYASNKYEIIQYACGLNWSNPELKKVPWKAFGALPDSKQELDSLNRDPHLARMASYGSYNLDRIIEQEKPDVYIAIQDIWGVDFAIDKPWFNKINSVVWTTLDSLPILQTAVDAAQKVKNYWIWSDFATKALNNMGYEHVKTMHGVLNPEYFYRLNDKDRLDLRKKHNVPPDAFIIGFVFRNQLRKSVPNLLEGYALWKNRNPEVKNTYLLLHTHWEEGWNIAKLAKEYDIDLKEVITTYICKNCKEYFVNSFIGHRNDCPCCGGKETCVTTSVAEGIREDQLNEVYNLMDVYCHPFTSGGQEIPIQEAKLTELITLVTNYSCGEDMCVDGSCSLPLEWSEYREHGTEFRKASTMPSSIAKQIHKVWKMPQQKRLEMGKQAREWTIENYSIKNIGEKIEKFLDDSPAVDWSNISINGDLKNPDCKIPSIENDGEWLLYLYHNILNLKNIDQQDQGYKYWMQELAKGAKREDIEK
jgi:glycosyltransferase involved in cell wall biosynthesis